MSKITELMAGEWMAVVVLPTESNSKEVLQLWWGFSLVPLPQRATADLCVTPQRILRNAWV